MQYEKNLGAYRILLTDNSNHAGSESAALNMVD
jgi:hypothetical protein